MWLLSCDGDLFSGKRLWLRPGSTHLLGRTSGKSASGQRVQYIDHKSVSRKHLVLKVSEVKPGDSSRLHVKTEVQAVDGSKTGTTVDGDKFNNTTRTLTGDTHIIKLGSYDPVFRLQWQPVVLSLTTLPHVIRGGQARTEALTKYKMTLGQAGVKITTEYFTNQTTHLIAKKRNTAAGLQALVQGRWLLTESFADALAGACARDEDGPDGQPSISLLEQDYETHWPQEEEHIVPAGGEPVARPIELLKPNPGRAEVFESMVFIFLSHNQHDQLMPVVTCGGGKTVVYPFELSESTTEDVIKFVREAAGKKGFRRTQDSTRTRAVVVRAIIKEEGREQTIMQDLEIALNQRSMEQNEFLDAILTNDATSLIRPLREATPQNDSEGVGRDRSSPRDETTIIESPSQETAAAHNGPAEESRESSVATRRRNKTVITASRFKGFDDFDPSQILEPEVDSPREPNQARSVQDNDSDARQRSSRKRRAVEELAATNRRAPDGVSPSSAGVKRVRREEPANPLPSVKSALNREMVTASKVSTSILKMDIKGALKEQREQEEARRRQDEEYLQNALDIDLAEIRERVQVEDFELPIRSASTDHNTHSAAPHGDQRWDPAWNGRTNFKKFRRLHRSANPDEAAPPRRPKRLVALEEVPRRGLGQDVDYFLQSSTERSQSQRASAPSLPAVASVPEDLENEDGNDDDDDDVHADRLAFRRRIERSWRDDAEAAALAELVPDSTAGTAGSHTLVADSQWQTLVRGKRPAENAVDSAVKKPKLIPRAPAAGAVKSGSRFVVSDDDDDDALKFRRKKR